MARSGYVGRHRFGHPGLVHAHELLHRSAQPKGRRWFRPWVTGAKHGGTVIPFPVRVAPVGRTTRRAA